MKDLTKSNLAFLFELMPNIPRSRSRLFTYVLGMICLFSQPISAQINLVAVSPPASVDMNDEFDILFQAQPVDATVEIDGFQINLGFDNTILDFVSITNETSFNFIDDDTEDANDDGAVVYAAGALSQTLTPGTIDLVTIRFRATAVSAGTDLEHLLTNPPTDVTADGPDPETVAPSLTIVVNPGGPLYVDYRSFTGHIEGRNHVLEWVTEIEENNKGFEVQRSIDATNWEVLGWVDGNGNSNQINSYRFIDEKPEPGNNYYRLKQIDFDGISDFSNVVILKRLIDKPRIIVTPNPSAGQFTVFVSNPNRQDMRLQLFMANGQTVWESAELKDMEYWQKDFLLEHNESMFFKAQIGLRSFTEKIIISDKL